LKEHDGGTTLSEIWAYVKDLFSQGEWYWDVIDITIVAVIIYQLLKLTRQTRAYQVLKGFGLIILASLVSQWLQLNALSWVSSYVLSAGAVVLVILFQPELRRTLEKIGRGRLLSKEVFTSRPESNEEETVNHIVRAVQRMSGNHIGALIVIQRKEMLGEVLENGTALFANISSQLIENIFTPNTPLHDGAIIVKDSTIIAAGCFLPMTSDPYLEQEMGTRHRAALGMSENSDALIIVVSEETGVVSVVESGKMERYIDSSKLRKILDKIYEPEQQKSRFGFFTRRKKDEQEE
jgi:diadenylate cyclase